MVSFYIIEKLGIGCSVLNLFDFRQIGTGQKQGLCSGMVGFVSCWRKLECFGFLGWFLSFFKDGFWVFWRGIRWRQMVRLKVRLILRLVDKRVEVFRFRIGFQVFSFYLVQYLRGDLVGFVFFDFVEMGKGGFKCVFRFLCLFCFQREGIGLIFV